MAIHPSVRFGLILSLGLALGVLPFTATAAAADPTADKMGIPADQCFYTNSLHYTNAGIAYWYSKEQGGIERITGKSVTEMGCLKANCHVRTCDECHRTDRGGRAAYTVDRLRLRAACARCHPTDPADTDVHFRRNMACIDCHTARELHGDATAWNTYMQPGVLEIRCESCHARLRPHASHTVHGDKLECVTCHNQDYLTCYNCHLDTRLEKGQDVQIEFKDVLFLVNRAGRVTTGNFLSYVYGNRTMITVAPYFSHSIRKEGRKCADCHATPVLDQLRGDSFTFTRWTNGQLVHTPGVIPVVEGVKWDLVYLRYEAGAEGAKGTWTPLDHPEAPLVNYAGWCTPLSREQLQRLATPQGGK
jgi:hypothetical protein